MRYLKSYRLFEADKFFTGKVDEYLDKIGSTREDMSDIFMPLIDQGYYISINLRYEDKIGRIRDKKTTNYETPILIIDLMNKSNKYIGGSTKFDNLSYIENIYHSLSRLNSMYGDNLDKITYELHNNAEITINCYFEPEEDKSMISISLSEMTDAIKKSISQRFGERLDVNVKKTSDRSVFIDIDTMPGPDDANKAIQKMKDELKKSNRDWANNYNSIESYKNAIIKVLESDLSKNFNMNIIFSHTTDHSTNREGRIDGIYVVDKESGDKNKLFNFSVAMDSNFYTDYIKKNIFVTKTVEIEFYEKIDMRLELI